MNINIAIDGPSAAGKSTIAKIVAKKLNYRYLDTGAMYRCVALKAKKLNLDIKNEGEIMAMLKNTIISFDTSQNIYLDNVDVSSEIRENDISFITSTISLLKKVRTDMVDRQRKIGRDFPGIIMDGRDIGSVVLPDAELKIFLVADPVVRAKRRFLELQSKGQNCDLDYIIEDINKRDIQDTTRANSPLVKVEDAIEVDTSDLTIQEVADLIVNLAIERGA